MRIILFILCLAFSCLVSISDENWRDWAIEQLWKERRRMGETPLVKLNITPGLKSKIYFKNETASLSQSLKHRFAWALTMWAVVSGKIVNNTKVYDSTSGNTGASEAYMLCKVIKVNYTAVVAFGTEYDKIKKIKDYEGVVIKTNASQRNHDAAELARKNHGFFMNQFGNADAAEEFHESSDAYYGSANVFNEILAQLKYQFHVHSPPHYFVHSAGTGGTISSVGKYVMKYQLPTKILLADSQFSLFAEYYRHNKYTNKSAGDPGRPAWVPPGIAGTGYGYEVEPIIFHNTTSLLRSVIDDVVQMPDIASIAAMWILNEANIDAGASTSLNFLVAVQKALEKPHKRMKIVTIVGDPGSFYKSSYLNATWINQKMKVHGGMRALRCWKGYIQRSLQRGVPFTGAYTACMPAPPKK